VTFGSRQGEFPGMLKTRRFEIVWIGKDRPAALNLDAPPDLSLQYTGRQSRVRLTQNTPG